jgi:hypothetical protein
MLVATIVPLTDVEIILSHDGTITPAFPILEATAVVMLISDTQVEQSCKLKRATFEQSS